MSVPEMIRTRSFARNIISRHGTADAIFDEEKLSLLHQFCQAPDRKTELLAETDMLDEPGEPLGTKANKVHGNLAGYLIAKHNSPEAILTSAEIVELHQWFESGRAGT